MDVGYLNFCPRCGRQDLDREGHGSQGTALCRACGTLFSVMSVRFGEKVVPVREVTSSSEGVLPVDEPSTETTVPLRDEPTPLVQHEELAPRPAADLADEERVTERIRRNPRGSGE